MLQERNGDLGNFLFLDEIVIPVIRTKILNKDESGKIRKKGKWKFEPMGDDFQSLSAKEKLRVIKATINTHYPQVTEGYIISYGEIESYELIFNKFLEQKKIVFSTNGELLEENMEQYIINNHFNCFKKTQNQLWSCDLICNIILIENSSTVLITF